MAFALIPVYFRRSMSSCCSCQPQPEATPTNDLQWAKLGVAGLVAGQSMIFGLAINLSPPSGTARLVLHGALALSAVVVFILAGGPLVRNAWAGLRQGRIVFDQLFLVGIISAFAASLHCTLTGVGHVYYEIVAILLAIYTFGRLLTDRRRKEALAAAADLGSEFSTCQRLSCCGSAEEVPVSEIVAGDRVSVPVGGAVTIDGVVESGVSFVQEAALTGEVFPVVKRPGDEVRAGSHAIDGALVVRATASGVARRLDDLIAALKDAQSRPSHLQREADRLASWFLPIVFVISLSTFAFWTWRAGWAEGLFNALAVLLVACPCSMGIATPVAIWSALSAFARRGLIARDGDLVERLGSVDTVVFDKTGTLGEEAMEIVDFVVAESFDRTEVIGLAAALETVSQHPVARAFQGRTPSGVAEDVRLVAGAGLAGRVGSHEVSVGNDSLVPADAADLALSLRGQLYGEKPGSHHVFVLVDGRLAGVALLREKLRDSARSAIHSIEEMGMSWEIMTGDQAASAAVHGLEHVTAGLQPSDKARLVREATASGRRVLFVGDGINDAPAMAEAHASIAISSGSVLTRESSMGELIGGDLDAVAYAINRSRKAVRAIRGNLLFAASYNVTGIILAACGFLHPIAAVLLMLVSSFTVTWRALRDVDKLPSRAVTRRATTFPWLPLATSIALVLQGPLISYLGAFSGPVAIGYVLLFLTLGVGLFIWQTRRRLDREAEVALVMFSFGGIAMLLGWWADVGFAAVVRDGVCLCNCADSTMGLGLFGKLGWMQGGMLAASIPMFFFEQREGFSRWMCWGAGLIGMLIGMEASVWLASHLPSSLPQLNFFATYSAMALGMCVGMTLACSAWRKISR